MREFAFLFVAAALRAADGCTSIIVAKGASYDGSTMTTHNADCLDCDFRLGKVPAADWPEGSMRPVIKFRAQFPRVVDETRGPTYAPANVDSWLPQRHLWLAPEWSEAMILGYIPQVNHTYASLEGLYGIINENQVAIGESTCGAAFMAGPLDEDCPTCSAMFDVSELSRIALERATSAREAIQIMGDLAVEHGFYGSEWDDSPFSYLEAGESLQITDPSEAWIFHIMPDDTSTSAVWVAQRVPDSHFTAVANQFIIRTVPKPGEAGSSDFMSSANLWAVAARAGLWDEGAGVPLDFARAFAVRPDDVPHYAYSTRRMWRVFNLLAPSLEVPAYTQSDAGDYPFSAAPDSPITAQDVINIIRDHYEGTEFDLTKGAAAGPYGDPDRYDIGPSPDGSLEASEVTKGYFERSIALFRTSYSFVSQSRDWLPGEVGGVIWYSQYKPSASTFVPVWVGGAEVPKPYTFGSLFKYTKGAAWWAFASVGNWMAKYRMYIHEDVVATQRELETPLFESQLATESAALELLDAGDADGAAAKLADTSAEAGEKAVDAYNSLFETLITRYHDGYRMTEPEAEVVTMHKLFYPKPWLEWVGYFTSLQMDRLRTAIATGAWFEEIEPESGAVVRAGGSSSGSSSGGGGIRVETFLGSLVACAVVFLTSGVAVGLRLRGRRGYQTVVGA